MKDQKKKKQIFMVEDNEIFAMATAKSIEAHLDCVVKVYNSGEDMIKELYEKPDLLILDLNLSIDGSSFDGKQVLEIVKCVESNIPVVVLTSSNEIKISLELIKRGAVDFIQKNDNYFPKLLKSLKNILRLNTINKESNLVMTQRKKLRKRILISIMFFILILGICMI